MGEGGDFFSVFFSVFLFFCPFHSPPPPKLPPHTRVRWVGGRWPVTLRWMDVGWTE